MPKYTAQFRSSVFNNTAGGDVHMYGFEINGQTKFTVGVKAKDSETISLLLEALNPERDFLPKSELSYGVALVAQNIDTLSDADRMALIALLGGRQLLNAYLERDPTHPLAPQPENQPTKGVSMFNKLIGNNLRKKLHHYNNVRFIKAHIDIIEPTSIPACDNDIHAAAIIIDDQIRQSAQEFTTEDEAFTQAKYDLDTRNIKALAKYK